MTSRISLSRRAGLLGLVALLASCSGMRLIDSDVTSYARWQGASGAPGTTYRFERLPSQQASAAAGPSEMTQEQLEAAAVRAFDKLGLVNHPAAPLLIVQLGTSTALQPASYGSGVYGGTGVSLGTGSVGSYIGLSFPIMRYDPAMYLRELSIVMRDSRTNAVVYETRARHSGSLGNAHVVWPAMMEAALNGFPNPPAGPRRVNVEVPR